MVLQHTVVFHPLPIVPKAIWCRRLSAERLLGNFSSKDEILGWHLLTTKVTNE